MSHWLVTGASGFVGRAVCSALTANGHEVRAVTRRTPPPGLPGAIQVDTIDQTTDWRPALSGIEVVLHLAARVHVMRDREANPLAAFRAVNVEGTRRLAEAAVAAGVRRLILVSTIKVLGEATIARAFGPGDPPAPADPYAQSKFEAEEAAREVSQHGGLELVIVRPPLVHGPGVGGNLRRLMTLIRMGVPLPLAGLHNHRSLVGVENLTGLLLRAATVPQAAGQVLLVADQPPLSTPGLVRLIAERMGRSPRLWSVPPGVLRGFGHLTGKAVEVERLVDSLEVDDRQTRALLQWSPQLTLEEGVGSMVRAFERQRAS